MIQINAIKFQIMRKITSILMVMFLLNYHVNYSYAQGHNIQTFICPTPKTIRNINIPTIDISSDETRQVVVAQGAEDIYQGHCSTVLMGDGKTVFVAWSQNHAGNLGPLACSRDGGLTWSKPLDVPGNWWDVKITTPTMHRLIDPQGKERLFVFAGCDFPGNIQQSFSEDNGKTWSPMSSTGLIGECAPKSILTFDRGKRLVMWSDRRDPLNKDDKQPVVWQSSSYDGGLTWKKEEIILVVPGQWTQPCVIKSPNNKQLLMLMRENTRQNSLFSISNDDGKTWSRPKELPASLTGDRHTAHYSLDGRLVIAFRDVSVNSETKGHYVAWVGEYEDIIKRKEGQYRIKLLDQKGKLGDCGYSGVELLPDGTFLATTYVKYKAGPKKNSVVCARFKLKETDQLFKKLKIKDKL